MPEALQTAGELAPKFGVKARTIYKWGARKLIPRYTVPFSRLVRYKESDIRKMFKVRETAQKEKAASIS